jgi:hypothetical protein
MPIAVARFQATPNPDAVKCVLDRRIAQSPRSYRSPAPASLPAEDPVAAALLAVPGVRAVLLCDDWVTVSKEPAASWTIIQPAVRRALHALA